MVSLLEQYETETQQLGDELDSDISNPFRSGYVNATTENEEIFKSQRVQINLQDKRIDQFEKCAGQMAILFKPKTIRLLNIENRIDERKHLLVATETNELYYYSRQSKKFKSISKLKGNLVTAVGWNQNSNEKTTDAILVGTKKGLIFELSINTNNEGLLNLYIDSYCKQVYNIGNPITGIEIFSYKKDSENIYDIVVTTSKCLYEFIGNDSTTSPQNLAPSNPLGASTAPIFASIFSYYESKSINELVKTSSMPLSKIHFLNKFLFTKANFYEMPSDIGYSQLQIRNNPKSKKKFLAWMTGAGVFTYEMDLTSLSKFSSSNYSTDTSRRLISELNHDIISFPQAKDERYSETQDLPIGIALTEFHLAIFYKLQVKILCLLNKELVLHHKLDLKSIGGKTMGVWFDSYFCDFGTYTNQTIIKYIPNKESRKIWKIYLNKNEFDLAKQYCKDNPANFNLVLTKQAEFAFNNKKYIESAIYYAQTQNSFEEICLKYLELGDVTALRTFLTYKLNSLDPDKEITQTTVVISYIIEIYLNQLSDLIQDKLYDEYETLHDEFYKFLDKQKVKNCLKESKEAIYKIFSSHGNITDLIYFAEVMKDYVQIILHYLQEENYRKALEALAKQNNSEIYYKYSPIFFELLPKEIVDLWIKLGNQINPNKLLPSIASCSLNEEQANEGIRYLEYCINRLDSLDKSIHNNLLTLYLQHKPEKLLEYVKHRKGEQEINFDILMIARLCTERSNKYLNEACVYLYKMLGWYEEAVDLALNVNVDLAREVADSVNSDFNININESHSDELKKMLWLRIARHVIEKENDVNKAMQFLHGLNETIVIEDVLPYFPDFVTIDQFKDAIRSSLAAYTEKINSLKESIEQAANSAQLIRRDIQTIRQKSISVNTSDICSKCRFRLMNRHFYVFPCSHKFHADCLYQTSQPYLHLSRQKRIEELQKLLQDIRTVPAMNVPTNTNNPLATTINHFSRTTNKAQQPQTYSTEEIVKLKSELDELLAGECPWCGERILKSIDEPFIDPLKYESIYNSWL